MEIAMVKSRRAEHAEDTRLALVGAARTLFAERGYAATSIDDVAAHARVTKGAVYHHFPSKRELFRAVVVRLYAELTERLARTVTGAASAGDGDLWEAVRAGYQARLDLVSADPGFQRIVDHDAIAVLGHDAVSGIAQAELLPVLEEAVATGLIQPLPVRPLANLIGALVSAANREIAAAEDPDAAREDVGRTLDAFLAGLRRAG